MGSRALYKYVLKVLGALPGSAVFSEVGLLPHCLLKRGEGFCFCPGEDTGRDGGRVEAFILGKCSGQAALQLRNCSWDPLKPMEDLSNC